MQLIHRLASFKSHLIKCNFKKSSPLSLCKQTFKLSSLPPLLPLLYAHACHPFSISWRNVYNLNQTKATNHCM